MKCHVSKLLFSKQYRVFLKLSVKLTLLALVAKSDAHLTSDQEVRVRQHFLMEIHHENNHSLPSADSRRAVVNF